MIVPFGAIRFGAIFAIVGILSCPARAQSISSTQVGNTLSDEVHEIRDLVRAQAELLEQQRRQIDRQQTEIDELRNKLGLAPAAEPAAARDGDDAVKLATAVRAMYGSVPTGTGGAYASGVQPSVTNAVNAREASPQNREETSERPVSMHFGKASLTPGGWVDFTAIYRSRDVGSGLGTAFATIPFSNTVQGGLSETRLTAQNSRITLRADENFTGTRVFGYAEADFNGILPGNAYVSTNSDSFRLRVYFADLARGRWELLGGQSWSLLTPNRVAISPFLSEIYNTLHLDSNYQVGLTYARQTQIRAVAHLSPDLALGLSAENPLQYSGSAVTFPELFSTAQTDLNSSSGAGGGTATPTLHPDLIGKLAWDPQWLQRHWHLETSGLLSPVAILTPESVTGASSHKDVHEGTGISAAANLEIAPKFHAILTGFWSNGGGRYIGGLGPGFVVAQRGASNAPFQVQLIHSGSGIAGAEWQASRSTVASLTFSAAYFGRAWSADPSTGKLVGYGFEGSANSNNREIKEATFASQTTLWKQPGYGSVQMITQTSWILRSPWYVAPGMPRNAQVISSWANLRYVLP